MIGKPLLVDLFCCAGGAAMGYYRAGFEVFGVDNKDQPNYPFTFFKADAVEFLIKYGHLFDAIHASPPCQKYSRTKSLHSNEYPDLINPIRNTLIKSSKPYVIENVLGSPLINPIMLDGTMFNLKVIRKRKFESNIFLFQPNKGIKKGSVGAKNCTRKDFNGYYIVGGHQMGTTSEWMEAMGINWKMTKHELAESIPPSYTEFIGKQLIQIMGS